MSDQSEDPQRLDTFFDRADRLSVLEATLQGEVFCAHGDVCQVLDLLPDPVLALNEHRQIVFANRSARRLLETSVAMLLGTRLGEAIGCVHAAEPPHGCGTTTHCRACGAAHVLRHVGHTFLDTQDRWRLTRRRDDGSFESFDFQVWGAPLYLSDQLFTLVSLKDDSDCIRLRPGGSS